MLLLEVRTRPLSTLAIGCCSAIAVLEVAQIARGELYLPVLNYPDRTTLVMVCCLIVWGLFALRQLTDLQALSFSWVAAVSCVFAYEAVYKWSFHLAPFAGGMPPPELREFVLQSAVAATALVGFAQRHFAWSSVSWVWLSVFGVLWASWLLVGFPQLDGRVVFPQVIGWDLDYQQVYLVNRATKTALFVLYATLFPVGPHRSRWVVASPVAPVQQHDAGGAPGPAAPGRRRISPGRPRTGRP